MNNFKKWSGAEREKSLKLTNKAKALGLLQPAEKCRVCGQTKGILQIHNKNYDVTLAYVPKMLDGTATQEEIDAVKEVLVPLCWRCHMMYHSYYRNKEAVKRYFEEVKNGKMYPPVFKHDFAILREHGL